MKYKHLTLYNIFKKFLTYLNNECANTIKKSTRNSKNADFYLFLNITRETLKKIIQVLNICC